MEFSKRTIHNWRKQEALPEAYSWDNMKDGISMRMNHKKRKRRWIVFFICMGVTGMLSVAALLWTRQTDHTADPPEVSSGSLDYAIKTERFDQNSSTKTEITPKQFLEDSDLPVTIQNTEKTNRKARGHMALSDISSQRSGIILTQEPLNDPIALDHRPNLSERHIAISSQAWNTALLPKPERASLITSNDVKTFAIPEHLFSPLAQNKNIQIIEPHRFRLELTGGLALWQTGNNGITSFNSPLLSAVAKEETLPGFIVSIKTSRHFYKGLYWSTGVEFMQLYSIFNFEGVSKSLVNLEDIVTEVEINMLTGAETITRGAVQVDKTIHRKLQSQNRISGFNIPLSAGYAHTLKNWHFRADAGFIFNAYTFGKGKTLYNDEIMVYSGKMPFISSRPHFGLSSSIGITYHLAPKWRTGLVFSNQYYLSNWRKDQVIELKPNIFGIQASLGYTF